MPNQPREQYRFDGGLNASGASHAIGENELAAANNVDFSLEWGALSCRRGSTSLGTLGGNTVDLVFRHYNNAVVDSSPWYELSNGVLYRGLSTSSPLGTASTSLTSFGVTAYQDNAYLAVGEIAKLDDGSNTYNWIMDTPATPLSTLGTASATKTGFIGTFTVTSTPGSSVSMMGTGTLVATNWEFPVTTVEPSSSHVMPLGTFTGTVTHTVGEFGIDYILIGVSKPSAVTRISRDLSIGGTNFDNYWHAETTPSDPGIATLVQEKNYVPKPSSDSTELVDDAEKPYKYNVISYSFSTDPSPWGVARTDYQFIGKLTNPDWTDIRAVRVVVEGTETFTMVVKDWYTVGNQYSNISDTVNGVKYYQTLAQVGAIGTNTVILREGAASDPSTALKMTSGITVLDLGTYTNTSQSGATHRVVYREGGLLGDIYQVGLVPIATQTATDYGNSDTSILEANVPLKKNLWKTWQPSTAISEPWNDRVFIGQQNRLYWSYPSQPGQIQQDSETTVSSKGDNIQALSVWDRLIIINQNTVFEMNGEIFEGADQNWTLKRTGCRRGTAAKGTAIKTPHGVVLFGYDGISTYMPGYGIDTQLDWVMEKIGDAWRGTSATSPAVVKGSRVPAINLSYISTSVAAFAEGKLYLAVPTGSATLPNTVFVIDIPHKTVWTYSYPFYITSLYWDFAAARLIAGTSTGLLKQLEAGVNDDGTSIVWTARTRNWTTPSQMLLENVQLEAVGNPIITTAIEDNVNVTVGTHTATTRVWTPISLAGSNVSGLELAFSGTQSLSQQSIYQVLWDQLECPAMVHYYRTEYKKPSGGASQLDMARFYGLEMELPYLGTFTSTWFSDGTAIMTNTFTNTNTYSDRYFIDSVPFPPGARGFLFYQQITSPTAFQVHKTYLDLEQIGIKGLRRVSVINEGVQSGETR